MIVTPLVPTSIFGGLLTFRCMVEAIAKSYAIVKCGAMSKTGYLPIPFTFVAVGNSN